jgi:chorismate mutase/prephenate dehydratase
VVKSISVAYLRPPATHTHLACVEHFGSSIEASPKGSIEEIFKAVERREAHYGVVPIENSLEGVVNRTLDMFVDYEVKICGEILVRISHALLSRSGNSEEIHRIYSHPQAFGQCQKWLRRNYPHVQLIETVSTGKAAQMAEQDSMSAALASPLAGRLYGLRVVDSQIEDSIHNYTRFLILGLQSPQSTGRDKT